MYNYWATCTVEFWLVDGVRSLIFEFWLVDGVRSLIFDREKLSKIKLLTPTISGGISLFGTIESILGRSGRYL